VQHRTQLDASVDIQDQFGHFVGFHGWFASKAVLARGFTLPVTPPCVAPPTVSSERAKSAFVPQGTSFAAPAWLLRGRRPLRFGGP
jgi:hypothetical protein